MLKTRRKKVLAIDKVFITYKDKSINFELEKGTAKRKRKSNKPQSKIYVGSRSLGKWNAMTKVDESLGDLIMKTINSKTIGVEVNKIGFTMEITRGAVFFKTKIVIDNKNRQHSGLCKWVPSDVKDIPYGEYETFSIEQPFDNAQPGTQV